MPPPQTPTLLLDNVFDFVKLYQGSTLISSQVPEVGGYESRRVVDYRRHRTSWQPADDGSNVPGGIGHYLIADGGLGASYGVDSLFLDRGSLPSLAGRTCYVEGTDDAALTTWLPGVTLTIPLATQIGGDPTSPTMCVTEEGGMYALFGALAPRRAWRIRWSVVANRPPTVTGIILGRRNQMMGYSKTYDEDAGDRTQPTAVSDAGYQASGATYSWRTMTLDLGYVGAQEYDSSIRVLRSRLFTLNQPCVGIFDWGTYPERAWMYRLDQTSWAFAKTRVYRSGTIKLREFGAVVS